MTSHTMTNHTTTRCTLTTSLLARAIFCLLMLSFAGVSRVTASGSESLGALNQRGLKTVYVEQFDGRETIGRFVSSRDTELVLIIDGARQVVPVQEISRVLVMKRATGKGLAIGLLVGGLLGGLSTQGAPCADCGNGVAYTVYTVITGIGTFAGYKHEHKEIVYSAPASSFSALPLTR